MIASNSLGIAYRQVVFACALSDLSELAYIFYQTHVVAIQSCLPTPFRWREKYSTRVPAIKNINPKLVRINTCNFKPGSKRHSSGFPGMQYWPAPRVAPVTISVPRCDQWAAEADCLPYTENIEMMTEGAGIGHSWPPGCVLRILLLQPVLDATRMPIRTARPDR